MLYILFGERNYYYFVVYNCFNFTSIYNQIQTRRFAPSSTQFFLQQYAVIQNMIYEILKFLGFYVPAIDSTPE